MKNIAAQMVNFDREQMRRIANNMPEQYDEKPQVTTCRNTSGRNAFDDSDNFTHHPSHLAL